MCAQSHEAKQIFTRENKQNEHRVCTGDGPSLLSPGIHSFPFKLGLPLGLPSTFLGKHGWVQYYCKAALREPGGLVHKNQQVFIVMNPIDLNLEPPILAVSLLTGSRWKLRLCLQLNEVHSIINHLHILLK